MKKTLYLIPTPLYGETLSNLPSQTVETIHGLDAFIVERAKTCRRFVSKIGHPKAIKELIFVELDKHDPESDKTIMKTLFAKHDHVGLMSEAGCPGVADPGSLFVSQAHDMGILVIPLVGPSSILLALMASGLNGQNFCFHGYISPKKEQIKKDIQVLERASRNKKETQIFIETPYRNKAMIAALLSTLHPDTRLCIAANISAPDEYIRSHSVKQWKETKMPDLHKIPCIFLIGQS